MNNYPQLITSQHADKPNFMALVGVLTQPLVEINEVNQSMVTLFDADTARGQQQDFVAEWVGSTRKVSTPISGAWFSWNIPGLGWNEANWKGAYEPAEGIVQLDDTTFNVLLHNQIATNYWNGSVEEVQGIGFTGLQDLNIWVAVVDNLDMSVDIYVAGATTAAIMALIERYVIPPKTAGVRVNDVHEIDWPAFALDAQTSIFFGGLDFGSLT